MPVTAFLSGTPAKYPFSKVNAAGYSFILYLNIISDIYPGFLEEVTELASFLFSPQNVVVKKLRGQVVRCSQMVDIIKTCWRHLTDKKLKIESPVNVSY